MMATRCIPRNRCNSQMSGWISGSNPSVADGKVTRTACMHSSSGCCTYYYSSVEIRNCSGFYVYNLPPTSTCHSRYCGVNSKWPCDYSLICTVLPQCYIDHPLCSHFYHDSLYSQCLKVKSSSPEQRRYSALFLAIFTLYRYIYHTQT